MKTKVLIGLAILMLVVTGWVAAQDKPWFDMENCEMCKNFTGHPGLMDGLDWETLKISSGIMMLSTAKPEQVEAYRKANAACNVLGEKLQTGYQAHLCGSCDAMEMLMMKGAMMEDFETNHGGVMLLTSNDSTVVAELHLYSDRNAEEMKKMAPAAPVLE
jgi:hypothetical protein